MTGIARRAFANERLVIGVAGVVMFLVLWEGLSRGWWADLSGIERWRIKPIFISSPTRIVTTAYRMFFRTGEIWDDLATSAVEYGLGFALAVAVGIPLGLAAGWRRRFGYAVEPFLTALNATPQVTFLPLIIVWVGIGLAAKVVVIFLLAVLPLAINAAAGVRTAEVRFVRVARSFGASNWRTFRTAVLPSAVPFLLIGLRLGMGRAMIGIVVGEIYGATSGVGFMINVAGSSFETDKVFVGVALIALAGLALSELIRALERKVEAWRPRLEGGR